MANEILMNGRLAKLLNKLVRHNGKIMTWAQLVESKKDENGDLIFDTGDGMIDYNRIKFNRMDYAEQREYEASLKARRYFYINNIQVPKMIYDHFLKLQNVAHDEQENNAANLASSADLDHLFGK